MTGVHAFLPLPRLGVALALGGREGVYEKGWGVELVSRLYTFAVVLTGLFRQGDKGTRDRFGAA